MSYLLELADQLKDEDKYAIHLRVSGDLFSGDRLCGTFWGDTTEDPSEVDCIRCLSKLLED